MIECPECGTRYFIVTDAFRCPSCGEENLPDEMAQCGFCGIMFDGYWDEGCIQCRKQQRKTVRRQP